MATKQHEAVQAALDGEMEEPRKMKEAEEERRAFRAKQRKELEAKREDGER